MKEITLIPGVCADQARIKIRFDSKKDKFKKLEEISRLLELLKIKGFKSEN